MTTKRTGAGVLLLLGAFITTAGFVLDPFSQQMAKYYSWLLLISAPAVRVPTKTTPQDGSILGRGVRSLLAHLMRESLPS